MDKNRKRIIWICVIVIAALLAFRMGTETAAVQLDIEDHVFTISWETYETVVNLREVESMELLPLEDPGVCVDGYEDESLACGYWENSLWGKYDLYARKAISSCIVIKTPEQTLVFNYESDEATKMFFENLTDYCTG